MRSIEQTPQDKRLSYKLGLTASLPVVVRLIGLLLVFASQKVHYV